jgi:hypothetical protein
MSELTFDTVSRQSPYSDHALNGRSRYFIALLRHYADRGGWAPVVRVLIGDGGGFDGAMELAQKHRTRVAIIADNRQLADFYADRAEQILCGYRRIT